MRARGGGRGAEGDQNACAGQGRGRAWEWGRGVSEGLGEGERTGRALGSQETLASSRLAVQAAVCVALPLCGVHSEVSSRHFQPSHGGSYYYHSRFTDEKTDTQEGEVTHPRSSCW